MIISKNDKTIINLVSCVVANTIPRYLESTPFNEKIYFIGQAISFLFLTYALYINVEHILVKIIIKYVLLIEFSNAVDEMFFDPIKFGLNEIVIAIIGIIYTIYIINKQRKNHVN